MIKRVVVFGLFLLLFANLVIAADEPNLYGEVGGEDAEKIGSAIDNYTPVNEEGEFDPTKLIPLKSKAELRIEAINQWFVDNASWLRVVFGMVPEISWLFAINVYFMLFFLNLLLFHADSVFFLSEGKRAYFIGGTVYLVSLALKLFLGLAKVTLSWLSALIPVAFWAAVITIVVMIIVLVAIAILAPELFYYLGRWWGAKKEARAKAKTEVDRKVLHAEAEEITEE